MKQITKSEMEQKQEQTSGPAIDVEGPQFSIEGSRDLHATLDDAADDMSVRGFKCVKCGLAHMHDTNKHRASDSTSMSEDEAAEMEFNPNCHCGYNELAHRGAAYGVEDTPSPSQAASTAPIPDATRRQME